MRSPPRSTLAAVITLTLSACSSAPTTTNHGAAPVGDMSDTSYYWARQKPARVSASGEQVTPMDFEGSFLWSDYAAPWCQPCGGQSRAVAELDAAMADDDDIVFLTVMTSDMGGYGDPATRATASSWATSYGLDPELVVAAVDLHSITVPRHILYSPEGHLLFLQTGTMTAAEMRAVIDERRTAWYAWKKTGERASWMHPS